MSPNMKLSSGDERAYKLIKVHPLWYSFIKYCEEIEYGEIEKLKIEKGLPKLAEEVKKKIKFSGVTQGSRTNKEKKLSEK